MAPLSLQENKWTSFHHVLKQHGYILRTRYQPGFKASLPRGSVIKEPPRVSGYFRLTKPPNILILSQVGSVMDAMRASDRSLVAVKHIENDQNQVSIIRHLSSPELVDPHLNHCVPVLDIIRIYPENEDDKDILVVMPLLQHVPSVGFDTVEQTLDFMKQSLQVRHFLL
jgi:hypothetical protein